MPVSPFSQAQLDEIIDYGQYPLLTNGGSNDQEGYQIFTPEFIVKDMIKLIGNEFVSEIDKTILEPASGDGAFTVRILELRIKKLKNDKDYLKKSLIALSTIYSIEMDEELIKKQRNNIFSLIIFLAKKYNHTLDDEYLLVTKKIILTNFIWGETNIDRPLKYKGEAMGWYMPTSIKGKSTKTEKNRIRFANWQISTKISDSSFEYEDWEANDARSNSDFGGLFSDQ